MVAVLYTEINIFSIAVLLLIAYKSAAINHTKQGRLFMWSIWFVVAANIFDFLWKVGNEGFLPLTTDMLTLINFGYFTCFGISAYFWYLYSESKAKVSDLLGNKNRELLCTLPIILLMGLLVISCFNGCLFYFDEGGIYHRGPLFYTQQILAYGYIGVACLKNFYRSFKKENYAQREELFTAVYFVVPPLLSLIMQIFFQSAPIFVLGITVSFLMAYINAVNMLISDDGLTGIHNRRTALLLLDEKMALIRSDERLALYFLDIDGFKQVNDAHGHDEGDRVLKTVATALDELAIRRDGICGRYGGDEFVFAKVLSKDANAEVLKVEIQNAIAEKSKGGGHPCDINVSIGHAEYPTQAESMHDLIKMADMSMYEAKKKNKSTRPSEVFE